MMSCARHLSVCGADDETDIDRRSCLAYIRSWSLNDVIAWCRNLEPRLADETFLKFRYRESRPIIYEEGGPVRQSGEIDSFRRDLLVQSR